MSNSSNDIRENERIIRLKVDATGTMVNTLKDQQTGRGLSLVCPFPALEVNIPVHFGDSADMSASGVIHRIGVEDDPETGLPKLRLSIRADDRRDSEENLRATVVKESPVVLSAATANTDPYLKKGPRTFEGEMLDQRDSHFMDACEGEFNTDDDEAYTMKEPGEGPLVAHSDPHWAAVENLPPPSMMEDAQKTRRRQRAIGLAAWMMVFGIAAGGISVLGKAGVVDVESLRSAVSSGSQDSKTASNTPVDTLAKLSAPKPAIQVKDAEPSPAPAQPEESSEAQAIAVSAEESTVQTGAAMEVASPGADDAIEAGAEDEATREEIAVMLPTRWPVEYVSAYRLRNPNGVVVDVPGGLVKKEGWIELGDKYPMIRSVKAVQREGGARFVVYVNGDLPRYVTRAADGGVDLLLFRERTDFPGNTEQVAMLTH